MAPSISIGPRTLLNDCNHSATAIFWRSTMHGVSVVFSISTVCRINLSHASKSESWHTPTTLRIRSTDGAILLLRDRLHYTVAK